jgi:hypothetical protein
LMMECRFNHQRYRAGFRHPRTLVWK